MMRMMVRRDALDSGLGAPSHSYSECFQTMIIVTEASGDDYFFMPSMLCRIVWWMIMMKRDWLLHRSVL
jgi:hypothetical protein